MYTTENEQKFIDGLGGWKPSLAMARHKLLMRYYKAMKKRKDWGHIDPDLIKARIKGELGWTKRGK